MSGFNSIWVQIVTLKLSLISDPVSGDFAQIVSGDQKSRRNDMLRPDHCPLRDWSERNILWGLTWARIKIIECFKSLSQPV